MARFQASEAGNVTGQARSVAVQSIVQALQAGYPALQAINNLRRTVSGLSAASISAIYQSGKELAGRLATLAERPAERTIPQSAHMERAALISPFKYITRATVIDRMTGERRQIIVPVSSQEQASIASLTQAAQQEVDEQYAGQGFGLAPVSEAGATVEAIEVVRAYCRSC